VTDTSTDGTPSVPTGTVSFSANGAGTFARLSCPLSARTTASAQCSAKYKPSASGNQTVTARYHGDTLHAQSSGTTGLSVA